MTVCVKRRKRESLAGRCEAGRPPGRLSARPSGVRAPVCRGGRPLGGGQQRGTVRVVVQRVTSASVRIDGRVTGAIERGLVVLVGFTAGDGPEQVTWMADKVVGLRVFADDQGKMNRSVEDVGGGVLVVSQFTLYGEVARGRRPSFIKAAPPEEAVPLYEAFVEALRANGVPVATGVFGAMMDVALVNEGPVTLVIDR